MSNQVSRECRKGLFGLSYSRDCYGVSEGLPMHHNLHPLKGAIWGIIQGTIVGLIKGDTRSLDYGSYADPFRPAQTVHAASFFRPFLHRDLMS